MNERIAYLKNIIEHRGHRFTFQKERLLEVLLNSDTHLNAKEIFDILKPHGIGIATIYRNLDQFIELEIVKIVYIRGTSYYEMKIYKNKPLHIHFKCEECDKLIDVDSTWDMDYIKLNYEIEKSCNLEIHDVDILLKGICESCKKTNISKRGA